MRKFVFLLLGFQLACVASQAQMQLRLISSNEQNLLVTRVEIFDDGQREYLKLPYKDTLVFRFKEPGFL